MHPGRIVKLCYGGMMCVALGAGTLPVYLTTFSETFGGLGKAQLGQLPGVLFAGFVLGILISGPLADRFGARPFALLGFALSAGGLLLAASAPVFGVLLAGAGILGLGGGVLDMLMSPIVSAVSGDRRSSALNKLHAFYSIGAVSSVIITSAGIALGLPWRGVLAGLTLLPLICFAGFLAEPLPPLVHPGESRHRLRELLRLPRFLVALAIIFFIGASEEGMSQWLPAYAEDSLGFSKAVAGGTLAAYATLQALGRLLGSTHIARMGAHGLLAAGAACTAVCYAVCAWAPVPVAGLAAGAACGLAVSVLWPTNLGITADRMPRGGASMFGLMAAMGNLGCTVAPWAVGHLADAMDLHRALFIAAACPAVVALLAVAIRRYDATEVG
ncbi:MAG: MFS transporter [Candidatus Hydrogenedens sp.]|nr:MFS transporter [Candidatus Hydrogenedens sp.]